MNHRVYCAVYGCMNSSIKKPEISFFTLPASAERRSKWLRLISREDLADKPPRGYVVCEAHFNGLDILPGPHRKRLKTNSLPCLLLPDLDKRLGLISPKPPTFAEKYVQTNSLSFLNLIPNLEQKEVPISTDPPTFVEKYVQTKSLPCQLLPNFEKKVRASAEPPTVVEKCVQTDYIVTVLVDTSTQTSTSLSTSSPRKTKQESDPFEDRKRNKEQDTEKCDDRKLFHELCDRFLTKEVAEKVKAQTQ